MTASFDESRSEPAWRRPAPRARFIARLLFAWRAPGLVFLVSLGGAAAFALAAVLAPALLNLAPTAGVIAPIAEARAVADGAARLASDPAPFYALLLLAADLFAETPGRLHLIAKAFAAVLVAVPAAYFAAARLPSLMAALLTIGLAGYVAAPFAGAAEIALAFFLAAALAFLAAPADEGRTRARLEGAAAGGLLAALWLLSPAFSLAGLLALSACPFLTGRTGLQRYLCALVAAAALVGLAELLAPGLALARANAASGLLAAATAMAPDGALALSGLAASAAAVLFAAAVFGGGEHARGWGAGLAALIVGVVAARLAGASPAPVFCFAAALGAFSVASPFYDGVFRAHDRASVALASAVGGLTLFWTAVISVHAAGQFALQARVAAEAPPEVRAAFGLVQPGGPTVARWIEEGRFSTPEARELFALAPVDQSAMLLEAAGRARILSAEGLEVAILTGADAACVIGKARDCRAGGAEAAERASVVLVPRLDLDPATTAAKAAAEVLLYTEFRLAEQTPLWDVWVRRGAEMPGTLSAPR